MRKTKGRVEEKGVSLTELIFRTGSGLVLTSYFISYFYFYFYFYFILFYLKGHVITAWSLLANFDWSSRWHHHYPATSPTCYNLPTTTTRLRQDAMPMSMTTELPWASQGYPKRDKGTANATSRQGNPRGREGEGGWGEGDKPQAQQHEPVHATTSSRTRQHGPGLHDTSRRVAERRRGWGWAVVPIPNKKGSFLK